VVEEAMEKEAPSRSSGKGSLAKELAAKPTEDWLPQ
jgi:hypothetical protein